MKLFALNSSKEFGQLVARELGIALSQHEELEFKDGEHKSRPLENVRNQEVFVIQSLYADESQTINDKLCYLLFFIGALKDASAKRVTAVIPYLGYARLDQKVDFRDPVTTRYMAALFEAVGVAQVVTMDVHDIPAFQNSFRCVTENLQAKKILADYLVSVVKNDSLVVLSPDIGGIKRAELLQKSLIKRLQQEVPLAFMEKYRKAGVLSGETVVGDVAGKTVIMVDDMVSTGTTITRAAAACKKAGAAKIWVVITHGLFSGNAPEILKEANIHQIITTNTIPPFRLEDKPLRKKVEVLNVAPLFAAAIKRIDEGGSVTELLAD